MKPVSDLVYHITEKERWLQALKDGIYTPAAYDQDGFIHLSTRAQVLGVANFLYAGKPDLVLLYIDPERVGQPLVYENLEGGETLFPHLYAPLPIDAVETVYDFAAGEDGLFLLPDGED